MLYHRDIELPEVPTAKYHLIFTGHVMNAIHNDRYGEIVLPRVLYVNQQNVVEAETQENRIVKLVVREKYNDRLDLTIVIIPQGCNGIVKTAWLNDRNDCHKTLDRSKYVGG